MKSKIIFCFLFMHKKAKFFWHPKNPQWIFMILIISLVLTACDKGHGKYNTFAQCLSEKDAKMYGTDWCSHCKTQKKMFENSFDYVDYTDCDWNKDECSKAGIEGYPTWIINNKKYTGEQSLERLASLTGCELIEDGPQ
ncbi:MAG: protein disulfide isomerase family protein [Pseudomonadota bacterium]